MPRVTIIRPIVPQPVVAVTKNGNRRWIWGPAEPITDMCGPDGDKGTACVSWWEQYGDDDVMSAENCPIERPEKATVQTSFDGERWLWVVSYTEAAMKKHLAAGKKDKISP